MTKTQISADLTALRELYSSSVSVKAILDDFANRSNNQRVTKVDQILNRLGGANVQRWEVIVLFRKLEELAHGKFVEGRRGHPSRFEWRSSQIDVGKAAQGGDAPISPVSIEIEPSTRVEEIRDYRFPLRSGTDATFALPVDLTQKEAERLGVFLKSLAVPE